MNAPVSARAPARESMLEAARSILRERGYTALSTREVATAAGVPLSQIHYHFGSKKGLVIALFEYLNGELLERQRRLFDDPSLDLASQWARACDYLDEDLASGYVRVMHELSAAGWADPEIGRVVRTSLRAWAELVTEVARRHAAALGPLSPEDVGALVVDAFVGAESLVLTGLEPGGIPVRTALRRVGALVAAIDRSPR